MAMLNNQRVESHDLCNHHDFADARPGNQYINGYNDAWLPIKNGGRTREDW